MTKPIKEKTGKTKCLPHKCLSKEHGDQICEAIRLSGSTEDQSISYITNLCKSFCSVLDSDGRTALHTAALVGKNKVVLYLIAQGANVNYQDEIFHSTPLHFAIMSTNLSSALLLLKYGANAKIADKGGCIPADYMTKPCKLIPKNKKPILQGYSWGTNSNYNLGLVTGQAREFPEHFEVPLKRGTFLASVSMNRFHSLFLSTHGRVFACGYGCGGRLGFETGSSAVITPQYVHVSKHPIVQVSAGVDHSVFLTQNNKVLTCGGNDFHQLGTLPVGISRTAPQVMNEWHSKYPHVKVVGVAAAPFHTVIWSTSDIFCCGLNVGQMGLTQAYHGAFVDIPCSDFLKKLDKSRLGDITKVATSEGATVFATEMGTVFAFYDYEMHRIFNKVERIECLACTGGEVVSLPGNPLPSHHKNTELRIAFLLSSGDLFVWAVGSIYRISSEKRIWHLPNVSDFCLNARNVCIVDVHQEVFFGHLDEEDANSVEPERGKSTSTFSFLHSEKQQYYRRCIRRGKKMISLYRTHSVYCDPLGNNYIALQYDPRHFQKRKIGLVPNSIRQDIANSFSRLTELSGDCDVVVVVGRRRFPVHAYILSLHSSFLHEKLVSCQTEREKEAEVDTLEEKNVICLLDIEPDIFEEILHFMYTNSCVSLEHPRRFTPMAFEKGVEQWRTEAFVLLEREYEEDDITEVVVNLPNFKESSSKQIRWSKKLKYPLKAIKEASNILRMRELQELLLSLNYLDSNSFYLKRKNHHQASLPASYLKDPVYYRDCFPEFLDVAFRCEDGEVVRAHKCILMARSSYFDAMLGIRWNRSTETDEVTVSLPSCFLRPLLDFLYTNASDDVSYSKDLDFLCHVLVIAHQYMVEDLHHLCQGSLSKCLTLKNAVELLKFCQAFDADRLKRVIIEFICLNMPHFFDSRQLKALDEETLEEIGRTFRRTIAPRRHTKFWSPDDGGYHSTEEEEDSSDCHSHTDEIDTFAGFTYFPSETSEHSPSPTATQASSLPSLEDLELCLKNNPDIASETPAQWLQNRKALDQSPAVQSKDHRKSGSGSGVKLDRRKKCQRKKLRKNSGSSIVSSSSNSESENTFEVDGGEEPFSFEDLQDRMSTSSAHDEEGDWKFVGKIKNEKNLTKDMNSQVPEVQNLFGGLRITKGVQEGLAERDSKGVDGEPTANVGVISSSLYSACVRNTPAADDEFPSLDKAPFPTLSEALSMSATPRGSSSSSHFKRMPKMQSKSGKKSKKTQAAPEEQAKSPPSSPPNAWGWGGLENPTPLAEVMRNESSSLPRSVPKYAPSMAEKCFDTRKTSTSSLESRPDDFVGTSPSPRKLGSSFEDDRFHWNPVTNSVIESPSEGARCSFSSIMQDEVSYLRNLEHERNKPLSLIQLEEKAIRELLEFYGGEYNPEERVTVTRCGTTPAKPSWNVQYRNV